MAAHMLRTGNAHDKRTFTRLLGKSRISRSEIRKAIGFYTKYGSIAYAESKANMYLETARKTLRRLPLNQARINLETLSEFLVSRSF